MSGSIVRMEVAAPSEDPHRAMIESDFFKPGWWGVCACGEWRGPVRHSVTDVMRDIRDHFDEVDS